MTFRIRTVCLDRCRGIRGDGHIRAAGCDDRLPSRPILKRSRPGLGLLGSRAISGAPSTRAGSASSAGCVPRSTPIPGRSAMTRRSSFASAAPTTSRRYRRCLARCRGTSRNPTRQSVGLIGGRPLEATFSDYQGWGIDAGYRYFFNTDYKAQAVHCWIVRLPAASGHHDQFVVVFVHCRRRALLRRLVGGWVAPGHRCLWISTSVLDGR